MVITKTFLRYRKPLVAAAAVIALYAVLGFFLAPWLVEKNAVKVVREKLGAELRLQKVAINPFVLSLRIDGLEMDDPHGLPFARVEQIFVNFQLSSLFRWALTFDEVRLDAPELFVARDRAGEINTAFLTSGAQQKTDGAEGAEKASVLPLLIFNFVINDSALNWSDQVPVEPVETRFGPVNIAIANLNTLPDRSGQQDVVITTETTGTLSWSGALQLNPFYSEGHAAIKGSHFPLLSAYVRHKVGFDATEGVADVEFDYRVASGTDGAFEASVDSFDLQFHDVLVRTFTAGSVANDDRDVLAMPSLKLLGGTFRWPERSISAASLEIDDAIVNLYRDASGALNIIPKRQARPEAEPVAKDSNSEWQLSLDGLAINESVVHFEDHKVQPAANMGIRSLSVNIQNINNRAGSRFPTTLTMLAESGGTLTLDGSVAVRPDFLVALDIGIEDLALSAAHPYIRPLADVSLDSGAINMAARLQSGPDDPLQLSGDFSIDDFLIAETDEGSRLGSWNALAVNKATFSAASRSLDVAEIELRKPYGDILIAADGSVNLGRVKKADETVAESPRSDSASPLTVTIGKVSIDDAAVDFEDRSLPLPFIARIAELNGDMSTIATNSNEPSTVALEGKVDEYGFVRVSGFITPLETSKKTDIKVAFQNVEMPKLSAYTIRFAGREISSGRLDLDLGYKVTDSELVGENTIVLRDLELGDKVEHPGAMSLPLGLAVALLKDPDGKIDIDLPVRGNVDDPEFRYGRVVLKALGNLIIKIVASPFALLGNLLGVEANELEYIAFLPGRADLTPPEQEKAAKLAEALALRPELVLELRGVIDRESDGLALKAEKLDAIIAERLGPAVERDSDAAALAKRQLRILEDMYSKTTTAVDASAELDTLRLQFTTAPGETEGETFDSIAYGAELRRQLVELQDLSDTELAVLANARSLNSSDAVIAANADLASRISIGDPLSIEPDDEETVRMKVTLSAGAERELTETED